MESLKWHVVCDGQVDGVPCEVFAEGVLAHPDDAIPVPPGWLRMRGLVEAKGAGAVTTQPMDLNFHSIECELGYHGGPFMSFVHAVLD